MALPIVGGIPIVFDQIHHIVFSFSLYIHTVGIGDSPDCLINDIPKSPSVSFTYLISKSVGAISSKYKYRV